MSTRDLGGLVVILGLAACEGGAVHRAEQAHADAGPAGQADAREQAADAAVGGPDAQAGRDAGATDGGSGDPCAPYTTQLAALAATLEQELSAQALVGAALVVVIGECDSIHTAGVEVRGGAPVRATTRFQLASMTKMFTAVTALSLEESGVLDRRRPITDYVPVRAALAGGRPLTMEELLAHRSGLASYYLSDDGSQLDLAAFFTQHQDEPLWAGPGEVFVYNNLGFALAGLAMERAAGQPFAELMRSRVFVPAGMQGARMGATLDASEGGLASGYSGDPTQAQAVDPGDPYLRSTLYGPMGGAWASAEDLAAFMRALMSGGSRLLAPGSVADLARSRGPTEGTTGGYGQGLFVVDGEWSHGGSVGGYLSECVMHPSVGFGVALLLNADWGFPVDTYYGALEQLGGPWMPAPPVTTPAMAWVGTYEDPVVAGRVEVTASGGRLSARFVDLGFTSPLTAAHADVYSGAFQPWGWDVEMVFQTGPSGARYLTSRAFVALKQ